MPWLKASWLRPKTKLLAPFLADHPSLSLHDTPTYSSSRPGRKLVLQHVPAPLCCPRSLRPASALAGWAGIKEQTARTDYSRSALAGFAVNNSAELFKSPETTRSNHPRAFNPQAKPLTSTNKIKAQPTFSKKVQIFESVADLRRKLMRYIKAYNKTATPLQWTYSNPTNRIAA